MPCERLVEEEKLSDNDDCIPNDSLPEDQFRTNGIPDQWKVAETVAETFGGSSCTLGYSPYGEAPIFTVASLGCGYAWYTLIISECSSEEKEGEWSTTGISTKLRGAYNEALRKEQNTYSNI